MEAQHWTIARDLYLQCVELDPGYAPAWARLGRIHRVLAKFGLVPDPEGERQRAEEAFKRALGLNPDLSIAHQLYTALEVDEGRAEAAMLRLIQRLRERPDDPELLAGLVLACRYCGLLEASVAAHDEAVRLDASIRTSVAHSLYLLGNYERTLATDNEEPSYLTFMSLLHLGRHAEAAALADASFIRPHNAGLMQIVRLIQAVQTRDRALAVDAAKKSLALSNVFTDPEGFYYWGLSLAAVGEPAFALEILGRSIDAGFSCDRAFIVEPWLDSIRAAPEFMRLLRIAEERRRKAAAAFVAAGGDRLLPIRAEVHA
jgi:tetratricopeptide (TPR) repeat protein